MGQPGFDSKGSVITHVGKARTPLNACKQLNGNKNARIADGARIINMAFSSAVAA